MMGNKGGMLILMLILCSVMVTFQNVGIIKAEPKTNVDPENPTPLIELPWAAGNYFPEPDSIDVPLDTNISISFGRPPSIVNMSIFPEAPIKERTFESIYVAGGKYIFHLAELLEPSTTYTVTMVFGDESAPEGFAPTSTRTWNFTTMAEATEPKLEQTGIGFPIVEVTLAVLVIVVTAVAVIYKRGLFRMCKRRSE